MKTARIIIGIYGDMAKWTDIMMTYAMPSAIAQTVKCDIIRSHNTTLAQARNFGAKSSKDTYLIFLDADDELSENYVEEMLKVDADIIQPATQYIRNGVADPPSMLPEKDLMKFNYLVIGSAIRRSVFEAVGGFREMPIWEDYDLFARAFIAGAKIGKCEKAVYKVHVNEQGRNESMNDEQKNAYHAVLIEEYAHMAEMKRIGIY